MSGVIVQGTRVYSRHMDLFGHVTKIEPNGKVFVKWEPPWDQELPAQLVDINAHPLEVAYEFDPRLNQSVDEPVELEGDKIQDWQREAMDNDPFPARQLLDDNGYVVHEYYDSAAENDLGAALSGLINRCIEGNDPYIKANAEHVQRLMALAITQQRTMQE